MMTITARAAAQIRKAADQQAQPGEDMCLRLAAQRDDEEESLQYAMGFDQGAEGDTRFEAEGITVVVAQASVALLSGATLDFVELNPGDWRFIFFNPNDPAHKAPGTQA